MSERHERHSESDIERTSEREKHGYAEHVIDGRLRGAVGSALQGVTQWRRTAVAATACMLDGRLLRGAGGSLLSLLSAACCVESVDLSQRPALVRTDGRVREIIRARERDNE